MPSSHGEFATCLTMSIDRGELRALELRRSSTRKFDGKFDQGTRSHVGAARVRNMLVICNGSMSAVGKWDWGSYRAFPLGPDIRIPPRLPSSVRIAPVPSVLVEVNPEWRGYEYFVYNDEIILIDPRTHRIVAILPV